MASLLEKIGKFEKARVFAVEPLKTKDFWFDIDTRESSNHLKQRKERTQKKANR
jgi:hypothetical protein